MHLACPHCQSPIEMVESPPPGEVICPSCGSSFHLEGQSTVGASRRPGQRDLGRFQLLDVVGVGAFGTVYKARDPELDRTVAIKIPRSGNLGSSGDADRFLREARSVAQLRHASIVPVYETGQADGQPYLVSEFVEGVTLADLLTARRPTFRESAQLIASLADALHYAHQQGVVHRDVKPSNIMLEKSGGASGGLVSGKNIAGTPTDHSPRLMDFGLAKREAGEITMTMDGQILGTPAYMSPEQAKGEAHKVDGRSDVYSLGVILYELLTGELPFRGNRRMLLLQVLSDEPRPPRHVNDHIPRDLETICLKAMAKEPARRYSTAGDLSADLHRYLEGKPILARPVGQAERFWRWCQRNPALAAACGLAVIALVAVSIVSTLFAFHSNRSAEREFQAAENIRQEQGKTEAALDEAKTERRQAEDRLVRMSVSNGVRLMDEGDLVGSLPWLVKALEEEKGGADQEEIHRLRLGAVFSQCPKLVQAWKFDDPVRSAEFSPDGRRILIAAGTDTGVWDSSTGQALTHRLVEKPNFLTYLAQTFTPDGSRFATFGPGPGELTVWDGASGKPVTEPIKDQYVTNRVMFSPDGRLLLILTNISRQQSIDGQARVWDASTGKPITAPMVHGGTIQHAAFSPDGRRVVTASDDRTVRLWDATTGIPITKPLVHSGRVTFAAFSPDSQRVVTTAGGQVIRGSSPRLQGEARLWDAGTGRPLTPPMKHHGTVSFAVFSPDGKHLLTSSGHQIGSEGEQDVWVWDASGTAVIPPLQHKALVTHASFSPDGRYIVTASADRTVRVWNVATGEPMTPPLPQSSPVTHCVFSPDGLEVLTSSGHYSTGGEVRRWAWGAAANPGSGQISRVYGGISLSPDGRRGVNYWTYASYTIEGRNQAVYSWNRAQVVDVSTGVTLPLAHEGHPYYAEFSRDGRYVVTASGNMVGQVPPGGEARVWEAATGRPVGPSMRHDRRVFFASLSPDSSRLLTAGRDAEGMPSQPDTIRVWNVSTGKPDTERIQVGHLSDAVFSPDGRLIMTVTVESATMWDAGTGKRVGSPIRLADQSMTSGGPLIGSHHLVSFSPDGHLVIVAQGGATAQVRDGRSGEEVGPLLKLGKRVDHVQFSPEGRRVLIVTEDMARGFDPVTGTPITPPLVHGQRVTYATFSPNGQLVATASWDNGVRIWDPATGEPVTPVLRHSSPVQLAQFTPDSRQLITVASGQILTWDVAPDPRPVEDLVLLASLLSSRTFDSRGSLVRRQTGAAPLSPLNRPRREVLQIDPALQDLPRRYPDQFAISLRDRITWHHREADDCQAAGQVSTAILHLDRMVEAEPTNADFHRRRGKAYKALGQLEKAVDDYSEAIKLKQDDAETWLSRGGLYVQLKQWTQGLADYSKAVELKPDYWQAWEARGLLYAQQEEWPKAAADFAKSRSAPNAHWLRSGWHALALAGSGDTAGHGKLCTEMLQKFGDTENANTANDIAWFCVRFPDAIDDPARPLKLAELGVAKNPKSHPYLNTLGAALYRAKRFEDSIKKFEEAIQVHGQGGHASDWLFLAMAHHKLGHSDEAKKWLTKAQERIDGKTQEKSKEGTPAPGAPGTSATQQPPPLPWDQKLELKLTRAEAEALVNMGKKQN